MTSADSTTAALHAGQTAHRELPRVDATLLYNLWRWSRFRAYRTLLGRRFEHSGRGLLGRRSRLQVRPGGSLRIGDRFVTGDDVLIGATGRIQLGTNVFINSFSRIVAHDSIVIGDNVVIASDVSVLDHDHLTHTLDGHLVVENAKFVSKPIRIGSNVWLGDKVTVLKGVTIGDNVIVGANAVVTSDVEPGTIVAGVPARPIRSIDLG
ncbi:MAG: acyltransferase [Microthrixaceae bacterium]|nr:acyltransferase [Microthrixaceae bacterium]HPB46094.1 acyltransferase [Microthrixaceae bacterium]